MIPRLLTALLPRDHHGLQHLLQVNDLFLRLLLTQWFVRLSNTQNLPEKRSKNKLVCENTVAWPKGVARPLAKAVSYKKKLQFCKKKKTKFLIGFRFNPKLKVATWFNNQCFPYSREWLIWWLMFLFRTLKWISNVHAFQRRIVLEGERTLFRALCISLMLYSEAEDFFNIESAVNILTGCQDNNNECPTWARNGHCRGGQWQNYMKTNCKRSCGLCNGEEHLFIILIYF